MMYGGGIDQAVISRCAEYISYRGSTVRFMFDVEEAQTALTSIPFEEGWDITVNGKSVRPVNLCGGLIGLQLDKGANSIVMTYTPPYFRTSLWISAVLFAVGLYLTVKVEHAAERRRKVRMAFRAVELNISRMTVDQLKDRAVGTETHDGEVREDDTPQNSLNSENDTDNQSEDREERKETDHENIQGSHI